MFSACTTSNVVELRSCGGLAVGWFGGGRRRDWLEEDATQFDTNVAGGVWGVFT
jgi:hypothetical protein